MTFYMFNVTNAAAVRNNGSKPHVEVVGPYNYNELKVKHDIAWSDDKTSVRFKYNRTFTRVKTKCPPGVLYPDFECSLDDTVNITTGNIALMGLANTINNLPLDGKARADVFKFTNGLINFWHDKKDPQEDTFMTRPVHEVIWGYTDTILKDVVDALIKFIATITKVPLPPVPSFIQLQKNNPPEIWQNFSEVYTGKGNINDLFHFTEWAGHKSSLGLWTGTACPNTTQGKKWIEQANMINGTDGMAFQPELQGVDELYVFSEDLLRSARLQYSADTEIMGIKLRRYTLWTELLNNVSFDESMCAFDAFMPKGALNMTSIVGGPAFASKPHFLDADPVYRQMVDGIAPPNRSLHDTTLDLEPYTGAGMNIHQRLQVSVHMKRIPELDAFKGLPKEFYLPIIKVDEHGSVTQDLADQWKSQVGIALKAENIAHEAGIIAGSCFIALGIVLSGFMMLRKRRQGTSV